MPSETIAIIANLALTLSLIVAIVFGLAQIRTAKKDRRERLTLETLRNFQSREFAEILLFTSTTPFPGSYPAMVAWPEEGRVRLIQLLQQMESLGILLADGFIDIGLLDKTLGSFISVTWEKFSPMVLDMRARLPDPFLAEYFQWMAEQIDKRMQESPRKPFFETSRVAL